MLIDRKFSIQLHHYKMKIHQCYLLGAFMIFYQVAVSFPGISIINTSSRMAGSVQRFKLSTTFPSLRIATLHFQTFHSSLLIF
jgi:hypothetical protein